MIRQLNHGLTFANDATVNEQLLTKYSLWEYLTPCDADNINILNSCINRWRDEANKLFETTRFSYDPLSNFAFNETGKNTRTPDLTDERTPDLTDETTLGTDTTRAEAGYDVPRTMFDAEKTTNSGTDTVTHTGTDTITHTGTETTDHSIDRTGRSNVASQDLIAKERAIILDCISWYVEKFRDCFTVSLEINDYCCDRDLKPIADFLPPECGHGSESLTGKLDVIDNEIGALQQQLTDCCTNMATEIDDLKKSVADSKELLAIAISDKGVPTASDDTFATMADNITAIPTGGNWVLVADWDFTQSRYDQMNNVNIWTMSGVTIDSTGIHSGAYAQRGFGLENVKSQPGEKFEFVFTQLDDHTNPARPANQDLRIFTFYRTLLATGTIYVPSADSGLTGVKMQVNGFIYDVCDTLSELVNKTLTIELLPAPTYKNAPKVRFYIDGELKAESDDANGYTEWQPGAYDYIVVARSQNTTPFIGCYGVIYTCISAKVYKMGV